MHFSMNFSLTLGPGRAALHSIHDSIDDNKAALPYVSRQGPSFLHDRSRQDAFKSATYLRFASHKIYYSETRNITETACSRQMDQMSLEALMRATAPLHAARHRSTANGEDCTCQATKHATTSAAKKHTLSARHVSADATLGHGEAPGWIRQSSLGSDWSSVRGGESTTSDRNSTDVRIDQRPARQLLANDSHDVESDAANSDSVPRYPAVQSAGARQSVDENFVTTSNDCDSSAEQRGAQHQATSVVVDEDVSQSDSELLQRPASPAKLYSPAKSTISQDEKDILTFLEDLAGSRASASHLSSEQGKRTQFLSRASSFLPRPDITNPEPETSPGSPVAQMVTKQAMPENSQDATGSERTTDSNAATGVVDRDSASAANDAKPVRQSSLLNHPTGISGSNYDILHSSVDESVAGEDAPSTEEYVDEEWEWTDAAESLQGV